MARHKVEIHQFNIEDYHYSAGWSEEDRAFIGHVVEFPSLATDAQTLAGALREIKKVVASVLDDLSESGEPVPRVIQPATVKTD